MNIIRFPKNDWIRIEFGFQKMIEYEYQRYPNATTKFQEPFLSNGEKKYNHKQHKCYIPFVVYDMQLQGVFFTRSLV